MKVNIEKYLYNKWFWIILFIILVIFGIITIKFQFNIEERFNPWETCPDTQNFNKGGVIHPINEDAINYGNQDWTQQLDDITKKNINLKNQVDGLKSQHANLQAELDGADQAIQKRDSELENEKDKYDKLDALYKKTDGQLDSYKTQTLTLNQQLEEQKKALKLAQSNDSAQLSGLKKQITNLTDKYQNAMSDLRSAQSNSKKYQNLLRQSEKELVDIRADDNEEKINLKNANKKIIDANKQIADYKKKLTAAKNRNIYTIMNKFACPGCPTLNSSSEHTLKQCQEKCNRSGSNCQGYMYYPGKNLCIIKKELLPEKFEYNKYWDLGIKSKPGQTTYSLWNEPTGFKIFDF